MEINSTQQQPTCAYLYDCFDSFLTCSDNENFVRKEFEGESENGHYHASRVKSEHPTDKKRHG